LFAGASNAQDAHRVEPFEDSRFLAGDEADCSVLNLAFTVLSDRCSDADGCTFRLTAEVDHFGPAISSTRAFILDSASGDWWADDGPFDPNVKGKNNDGVEELVLRLRTGWNQVPCELWDDKVGAAPEQFALRVCVLDLSSEVQDKTVCVLRIDD
jgi:hypothetical protein